MRRPVKPFVTEYRGGTRRQGPPGQNPLKGDSDFAEPRAEPRAPAWPQGGAPEDGYEAALRAADALFSGGRAPAADETRTDVESTESQPGAGRVLRSLDEPPSEEMARLEAEYAPKKRGRKPGSKNKPKIPSIPAFADDAPRHAALSRDVSTAPVYEIPARNAPEFGTPALVSQTVMARPAPARARPAAALVASPSVPRGERYAWVRTRLKPGEQWKRRLPKVAW